MAYSELIKSFEKIRDYMRDFLVYGFRSREDFTRKSARSYDDVRFIYVRPREDYLRLEKIRDVIELPIEGDLDINGWDLSKTLRLLRASNPTLFEWFSSPVVYRESGFAHRGQPGGPGRGLRGDDR